MAFFGKQPSSRLIKAQNLLWTGTGTLVSTPLASETFQVRIIAQSITSSAPAAEERELRANY
jgi:hypothetical protein